MRTASELAAAYRTITASLVTFRGGLRRLRPVTLDWDAADRLAALKADNEAIRRLPTTEQQRIELDIRREHEAQRRGAASHARHQVRAARELVKEGEAFIARTRRDTALSFPDATEGLSADGLVNLALLRVHLAQHLRQASAAQLFATYQAAHQRRDARGLVEAELVEELVTSGQPLAAGEADLPILRELREYVDGIQELRVPLDLPNFAALLDEADRLDARAEALQLHPTNEAEGRRAFEAEHALMTAAGQASDADDQAALRVELQRAGL